MTNTERDRWTEAGAYLRTLRTAVDATQKEVATAVGVGRGMISMVETGESAMPHDRWERLAAALRVDDTRAFTAVLLRCYYPDVHALLTRQRLL